MTKRQRLEKKTNTQGRLTLPSEENFLQETKEIAERLGADAVRDSDGTKLPDPVKDLDLEVYTTYFVAREYNDFIKKHVEEVQQIYLMSNFQTAFSDQLEIDLMEGYFREQILPDTQHDPKKYWQVIDRTSGEELSPENWEVSEDGERVIIKQAQPYHQYTVNFLAYLIWDMTSMYNHITNDWGDREHQIPFNAMGPNSSRFMEDQLERWLQENPKTDIVRFTTFFYHFTLVFNDQAKEKFVDWFGYSASVSVEALQAFEKEYGYALEAEDLVDQGYYNNPFRIPSKEYLDYMDFMGRFVSQKAKRLVDLVHKYGKKAVMFLGDNWIGTEPYGPYFKDIGLDGVVGSVGDGVTLRLISDIKDVDFTEGRFLPYFFPDTFFEGNDQAIIDEARQNWVRARRAILRSPIDRIGYGGYLSLAHKFPSFISYISDLADEYRDIMDRIEGSKVHTSAKVAILNYWGELRSWQAYIVAHGKWYKRSYSYIGLMEALAGMDMEVVFLSFDDILEKGIDSDIDVIINAGDAGTAWSGAEAFNNEEILEALRAFVYQGGGFIGVGEPSAYPKQGRYFQLADILGVDREMGFSQSTNVYNVEEVESHYIWGEENSYKKPDREIFLGEPVTSVYAIDEKTQILLYEEGEVKMASRDVGQGRSFYMTGLAYNPDNSSILRNAILYVAHKEEAGRIYSSSHPQVELAAYPDIQQFCVYNNSDQEVRAKVYDGKGQAFELELKASELIWFKEEV